MTAKVNLKEGKKKLIGSFLSGNYHFLSAAIAIPLHIYKRTSDIVLLREFGFVIFALLTVYFY
jgi:hypothetical protein